jgi:hypothetical protein
MRTPDEHAVAATIIQLMRGVVYGEHDEPTWTTLDETLRPHATTSPG